MAEEVNKKEIVALDTLEAVRLRPGMYVGKVSASDEKRPLVIDNKIQSTDKTWSPGFFHLFIEIFENALDEAKRCKGKMKSIDVVVNLDDNKIIISDSGEGFHNASKIHPKTKKNVVRTALEELHAGSNFIENSEYILGTNGVGSAVVNILSSEFSVVTVNKTDYVSFNWNDYKITHEEIRKRNKHDIQGTTISFIPTTTVFKDNKWDIQLIASFLSYKAFLIKADDCISNLKITAKSIKNGSIEDIIISSDFIPKDHVVVNTKLGTIYIWERYDGSDSISFVNGSQCNGIHQKIVQDWCNEYFEYNLAHHFYDTLISLNVPSNLMRFSNQNKSEYDITRKEIEEPIGVFKNKLLHKLRESNISKNIEQSIEDRMYEENIKKIKRQQKTSKRKISDKYSPPSMHKGDIFIVEGLSASGSCKQARDSKTMAVYALKGKVKNTKKLSDLSNNAEIIDLINILNLEIDKKNKPSFERIIIATDSDTDGYHITALILNFFSKWFPHVIDSGHLFQLLTPLVSCTDGGKRKYFYSLEEFNSYIKTKTVTNINYLKGLGSLSMEDWEYVMNNKTLFKFTNDSNAAKYIDIAFGASANKRKDWLEGKIKN